MEEKDPIQTLVLGMDLVLTRLQKQHSQQSEFSSRVQKQNKTLLYSILSVALCVGALLFIILLTESKPEMTVDILSASIAKAIVTSDKDRPKSDIVKLEDTKLDKLIASVDSIKYQPEPLVKKVYITRKIYVDRPVKKKHHKKAKKKLFKSNLR